ncbi:hypothetical protein C2E20_4122 [Micractinium conductrix]|uniref:Uncharacterized protein n=1 Tax=Micractinium conductrix TaxID=554055 RepID=A0A2P6VET9_9CHLO|nr:hypothetical protein C2E20_4122 [Micractinium conductrix]|eukprot:PSC72587.1 hypothetical protein C2E20_4122 [Micractinium conductrix]
MADTQQTPKKQRKGGGGEEVAALAGLSPAGSTPSPGAAAGAVAAQQQQQQPAAAGPRWMASQPLEAGGSNEAALLAAAGGTPTGAREAVTDAAKAFRELRVRPGRTGSGPVDGEGGGRGGAGAAPLERPSSPKKRKASYNIDKEFILKDDKVKRNADTQGDISQARGQLGQLLFEFSQIELNRDLLDAIKRTESKTGRSGGRAPVPHSRLDRAAFEVAVADAAELLQAQLNSVEAHCEDAALRGAILRTYAVQAIAAFADEDSDSDEDGSQQGKGSDSSDDENADSNSQRQRGGSSSLDGPAAAAASAEAGSQSQDMLARPASAAGCHSPLNAPAGPQQQQQEQQAALVPGVAMLASPSRPQPAGSAAGQASSSILPDAPSDSALEDTATARQQDQGGGAAQRAPAPGGGAGQQLPAQHHQLEHAADDGLQRMRMLSLEAEGSVQQQSGEAEAGYDGPTDMIRSPAPVTSRRMPLAPAPAVPAAHRMALAQEQGPGTAAAAAAAGACMAAELEEARQLAVGTHTQPLGRQEQQQAAQQLQEQQEQQQESSEGHSTGQTSSAAPEPPKRQRRSGDLLPPLFERSSQQRRHNQQQGQQLQAAAAAAPQAAPAPAAAQQQGDTQGAAVAQRAAILGNLHPGAAGERRRRLHHVVAPPHDLAPEGPAPGEDAAAGGGAAGAPPLQEAAEEGGVASDATLRAPLRAGHSNSSVWGSTLVCADLTVNDVASQYWPFLRSAMRGQAATLQAGDRALVANLVQVLGDTISDAYIAEAGHGRWRRPSAEVKSLVAATAFDDFFRAQNGAESEGASLGP